MKKNLFVVAMVLVVAGFASADLVNDDFDNGVLDPAWVLTTSNATSHTMVEAGSSVMVTDMQETAALAWTQTAIAQTFAPTDQFHIDFEQSYYVPTKSNMPLLRLFMYDGLTLTGLVGTIADSASYGYAASYLLGVGQVNSAATRNTTSETGSFDWDVDADGSNITISLNGTVLQTAPFTANLDKVVIAWDGFHMGNASIGWDWAAGDPTLAADYVNVVVPEPASMVLLGLGALVLRKRK
jgi:hypothetical protein